MVFWSFPFLSSRDDVVHEWPIITVVSSVGYLITIKLKNICRPDNNYPKSLLMTMQGILAQRESEMCQIGISCDNIFFN